VVVDAGDAAFAEIERGERLQHVVQLRAGERDGDVLAVDDVPEMFEVADAGACAKAGADASAQNTSVVRIGRIPLFIDRTGLFAQSGRSRRSRSPARVTSDFSRLLGLARLQDSTDS